MPLKISGRSLRWSTLYPSAARKCPFAQVQLRPFLCHSCLLVVFMLSFLRVRPRLAGTSGSTEHDAVCCVCAEKRLAANPRRELLV